MRLEHANSGRRIPGELSRRTTWTHHQLATAIGTDAPKFVFGARSAERALEGTDPCLRGIRGQITITALTARHQLEHAAPLSLNGITFDAKGCRRQVPLTEGLGLMVAPGETADTQNAQTSQASHEAEPVQ